MAYSEQDIEAKALIAITEEKLTFFDEISLYIEPSRATLYNLGLDKLDTIKDALGSNKIAKKKRMRNKWEESDNATLQIAAYKLIADPDEIDRITMNKVSAEHTGKDGGAIKTENKLVVEIHDFTNGAQTQ